MGLPRGITTKFKTTKSQKSLAWQQFLRHSPENIFSSRFFTIWGIKYTRMRNLKEISTESVKISKRKRFLKNGKN